VLKWAIERIEGKAAATETPIGHVPHVDDLDLTGLDVPRSDIEAALKVDVDEWRAELPLIDEWFDKIGSKVPTLLRDELEALKLRLA
jgi:phosphoenolpyruvate carboxykinase (GTP)